MSSTLPLLAFLAFAVADWVAVAQSNRNLEQVAKPAALGALIIWAAASPHSAGWLITALVLSLLGDVYLMLPEDRFVAGLSSFLLAHLAYIACFDVSLAPSLLWLLIVLGATAPITRRILISVTDPTLRVTVATYMLVIGVMVSSALASGLWLAAAGALLFCASDLTIAWSRFVRDFPSARIAIIVTYHLGQWGLTAALR